MPASPRATGPVSARSPWRSALSSAAPSSGPSIRCGFSTPAFAEQVGGLGDQRDQVVGAEREPGVVEPAVVFGDPDRLGAHLDDERLGGGPELVDRGDAEADALSLSKSTSVPVNVMAGCSAIGSAPSRSAARARDAVGAAGVGQKLPAERRAGAREPGDKAGKVVIGDGQQHEVGAFDDGRGVGEPRTREVFANPRLGHLGHRGGRDHLVTRPGQRPGQRGPRPPRADHSDGQARGMGIRSSLHEYRTAPFALERGDKDSHPRPPDHNGRPSTPAPGQPHAPPQPRPSAAAPRPPQSQPRPPVLSRLDCAIGALERTRLRN